MSSRPSSRAPSLTRSAGFAAAIGLSILCLGCLHGAGGGAFQSRSAPDQTTNDLEIAAERERRHNDDLARRQRDEQQRQDDDRRWYDDQARRQQEAADQQRQQDDYFRQQQETYNRRSWDSNP